MSEHIVKQTNNNAKGWMWFLIILFFVITVGLFGIYYIVKRNWFKKMQEQINISASNISAQLIRRRDTLIKLVDATKTHMKYEKETLQEAMQLKNMEANIDSKNFTEVNNQLTKFENKLFASFESYPQLRASMSIGQLMNAADLSEKEITASRAIYNQDVSSFNKALLHFPAKFIAIRNKLHAYALFEEKNSH